MEESTKDAFYDCLQTVISKLPDKEIIIPCGDWNRHIGREAAGCQGNGHDERSTSGDRVLGFAVTNDIVIGKSFFDNSHLITSQSENGGEHQSNTK